jgi:hypothetical protein
MAGINFVDIDNADLPEEAPSLADVGVVLFGEDGRWTAMRSATGAPVVSEGSLRTLGGGFWLTDVPFEGIRSISEEMKGSIVRADGWIKMPFSAIRDAWDANRIPRTVSTKILAGISQRVFSLAQESILKMDPDLGPAGFQDVVRKMKRSSSLALGLAQLLPHPTRALPDDKRLQDHLDKAHQLGIWIPGRRDADPGEMHLTFRFPRFTYAKALGAVRVPGKASWQVAARRESLSSEDFLEQISATGRPIICKAVYQHASGFVPEHVEAFAGAPAAAERCRNRFLPDEIGVLSRHYDVFVEGVVAGGAWEQSATGRMIDALEEVAGGTAAAAASWSAGLLAENMLASAFRKGAKDRQSHSTEAVWLAERDRVMMFPAISRLCEAGGVLVSAQMGAISIRVPADPELLMVILGTAWELGLHVSMGDVARLEELGVPIPSEQSLFGGNDVDYFPSAVVHRRGVKALWALDGLMDLPARDRPARIRALLP